MRKRGPKNSVEKQPQELILQINGWLLDDKLKLEDIVALIEKSPLKNNVDVSVSALNRYQIAFDREMKKIKDIRELVNNLPKEFSFDDESKFHSALAGMLSKVMFEFLIEDTLSVKDLGILSKSLENIMSSMKDREKIKADLRIVIEKEIKQAQANKLKTAKDGGKLSKKSFDDAMRILGL